MRILNVSSLYPPNIVGGAEMGLKTMSEAMVDLGHQLHVVTLQPPTGTGKPVGDPSGKVIVHGVPLANIYWPFGSNQRRSVAQKGTWHGIDTNNVVMARRVKNIVASVQPDIVLTRNLQGLSTAVIPAVAKMGIPTVHVLHDYGLLCPQTTLARNGEQCGTQQDRCKSCKILSLPRWRHARHLSGVIGVSQSVLDTHIAHGLFTHIPRRAIYNALSPRFTIQDAPAIRSPGPMTFGYLARIEKSKGIETLLEACAALAKKGHDFRLRVAGRGHPDYVDSLKRRFPLPQVSYEGFVDAPEFLYAIDTLIFPSQWQEALGNGVFEAFSQGTPVIGSDRGGIPESIDHNINGRVFRAGSVTQLGSQMIEFIDQPARHEALGKAALDKASQYLAQNRASEYLDFLTNVVLNQKKVS